MDTPPAPPHLELSVANFGPIAQGRIELRPLTVFVGPSNTGKSYLAVLIYALHKAFNERIVPSRGQFIGRAPAHSPATALDDGDVDEIVDWVNDVLAETDFFRYAGRRRFRDEMPAPVDIPEPVASLIRPDLSGTAMLGELLDDEITRCFGAEQAGDLSSYLSDGLTRFAVSGKVSDNGDHRSSSWEYEGTVSGQTVVAQSSVADDLPLQIVQPVRLPRYAVIPPAADDSQEIRRRQAADLLDVLSDAAVAGMVGPLNRPAYYLPADRSGVMHAHQVVVRALIASATRGGIRQQAPLPILSGVLGDFLDGLIDLAQGQSIGNGLGSGLAKSLEKNLLKGDIKVRHENIDYPSFVYRPDDWERDLPIMNASSMVSELAPVALYLRHVVQEGDTLIIEEPESHLHPEMQVVFVRQLAAAVKAGIRIIITTHSEWILEELANLIRLSDLPAERRRGIAGADVALGWDEVGAWFFEPGEHGKGSKVRKLDLDLESGIFQSGFGLVTETLYNRWAEISNRIEEAK